MDSIKILKYKKVKNFLAEEERNLLLHYTRIFHRINFKNDLVYEQTDFKETSKYGDPIMESLLINKKDLMEKETGLKLHPSYSFWRMYNMFSELKPHTDRPSCEISVSVHIGSDGTPYPLIIDGKEILTEPGEAIIYLGTELNHYRKEYTGDWYSQVFLHYVDANGPWAYCAKDNRSMWATDADENWISETKRQLKKYMEAKK